MVFETELPELPGHPKAATVEGTIYTHGALGYVREADWAELVAAGGPTAAIPLSTQAGEEIGRVAQDDLVMDGRQAEVAP